MSRLQQRWLVGIAFAAVLLTGLAIYQQYGYSWDEQISRWDNGRPNFLYLTRGQREELLQSGEKYHGPAFEIVLFSLEKISGLEDSRSVYLMRHLVTFLLFFAAVVVFHRVLRRRFHSRLVGLVGAAFLVLSPRIFADAFYNSKDLALLSAYIFALATLDRFLRRPDRNSAILHALACGFLIDIRIVGVVLPCLTCALLLASRLARRRLGEPTAIPWKALLWFSGLTVLFVTLFWPILWRNPPREFLRAFREMRSYPWDGPVLYRGETIRSTQLPWHYLPWWMLITTPEFYTSLFVVGLGRLLVTGLRRPIRFLAHRPMDIAWVAAFMLPLGAVIALHSVVYDGWRHLYFIYPAFLFCAVHGFVTLYAAARLLARRFRFAVRAFLMLCVLPLALTVWSMVRDHPYQNVYFNSLAGPDMQTIKARYEMDYWGLSCREGLEKLLSVDPRPVLTVVADTKAVSESLLLLRPEQRARLRLTNDLSEADYFLSHFRYQREPPGKGDACAVCVGNASLFVARKLHSQEEDERFPQPPN